MGDSSSDGVAYRRRRKGTVASEQKRGHGMGSSRARETVEKQRARVRKRLCRDGSRERRRTCQRARRRQSAPRQSSRQRWLAKPSNRIPKHSGHGQEWYPPSCWRELSSFRSYGCRRRQALKVTAPGRVQLEAKVRDSERMAATAYARRAHFNVQAQMRTMHEPRLKRLLTTSTT